MHVSGIISGKYYGLFGKNVHVLKKKLRIRCARQIFSMYQDANHRFEDLSLTLKQRSLGYILKQIHTVEPYSSAMT